MISALAVVCIRNEAVHVRRCLRDLIESGLEVHLIDHQSTDGTREIAAEFLGGGLLAIDDLPWTGVFSLSEQLRAKKRIFDQTRHDWVVHIDADERLESANPGETLLEGLQRADAGGYNCVNFLEMAFVPLPGENFNVDHYASRMCTYYYFAPVHPHRELAWRRDAQFDNSKHAGHRLTGADMKRFPEDFIMRHYIALSQEQAREKFLQRRVAEEDLAKCWFGNRLAITEDKLVVKPIPELRRLDHAAQRRYDLSQPLKRHFWQWSAATAL
jgi:glycosyltransferase involved in cell wall biosynthesis